MTGLFKVLVCGVFGPISCNYIELTYAISQCKDRDPDFDKLPLDKQKEAVHLQTGWSYEEIEVKYNTTVLAYGL
jgi:hypothetical protein